MVLNFFIQSSQHTSVDELFKRQVTIARSFDIIKQQVVFNPNIYDEMKELSGFKKAARKISTNIDNADAFVNYLENTGFEKLEEAGKALEEQVNISINILCIIFLTICFRMCCIQSIYGKSETIVTNRYDYWKILSLLCNLILTL